jgi:hypothetical protein
VGIRHEIPTSHLARQEPQRVFSFQSNPIRSLDRQNPSHNLCDGKNHWGNLGFCYNPPRGLLFIIKICNGPDYKLPLAALDEWVKSQKEDKNIGLTCLMIRIELYRYLPQSSKGSFGSLVNKWFKLLVKVPNSVLADSINETHINAFILEKWDPKNPLTKNFVLVLRS